MKEVSARVHEAVQALGEDVVIELAVGLLRARCLHPSFATMPRHAAEVVLHEAIELQEAVINGESPDRQHAEALDTAVTALRFMGMEWLPKFGAQEPPRAPQSELLDFISEVEREVLESISERQVLVGTPPSDDGYDCLRAVFDQAVEQAARGKGRERHASGEPFDKQTILQTTRAHGLGFATGQAEKKLRESHRLAEMEGGNARAVRELLGAINYTAAAIIRLQEVK